MGLYNNDCCTIMPHRKRQARIPVSHTLAICFDESGNCIGVKWLLVYSIC